jgi:hypothetical protein
MSTARGIARNALAYRRISSASSGVADMALWERARYSSSVCLSTQDHDTWRHACEKTAALHSSVPWPDLCAGGCNGAPHPAGSIGKHALAATRRGLICPTGRSIGAMSRCLKRSRASGRSARSVHSPARRGSALSMAPADRHGPGYERFAIRVGKFVGPEASRRRNGCAGGVRGIKLRHIIREHPEG